jgi:hypothetical protein
MVIGQRTKIKWEDNLELLEAGKMEGSGNHLSEMPKFSE